MRRSALRLVSRFALAFALSCPALVAHAGGAPANDDIANATVVSTLPFTTTLASIADATLEIADPNLPCRIGSVGTGSNTVWYRYTTGVTREYLNIDTRDADYDTTLGVYAGAPGELRLAAGGCNDDARAAPFGAALFGLRLEATTTYYIVVSRNAQGGAATLNLAITAAPVYAVTRLDDPAPDNCLPADCSLREAVNAANTTPGAVVMPAGIHTLSRNGANENLNSTGDLDIRGGMGIYGAGSGEGGTRLVQTFTSPDRAFHVDPVQTGRLSVSIADLAIAQFGSSAFTGEGGGVLTDGASASFFAAFVSFDRVLLAENKTTTIGGGIRTRSRAMIRNSTLANNEASSGGGLYAGGDTLTLALVEGSTFSTNIQTGNTGTGAGIHAASPVWLVNSTVSGNRARNSGGGIAIFAQASGLGSDDDKDALDDDPRDPGEVQALQNGVAIRSSSIVRNRADDDGNNVGHGGGLLFAVAGDASLRNTVIADNIDLNATGQQPDCQASAVPSVASSYNLIENVSTCTFFVGTGDSTGVDAALASTLADNGGVTQTHLPLGGSPLIDTGDPAGCTDVLGDPLTSDQRDVPYIRQSGAACDRGAIEIQPQPAIPPSSPDLGTADDSGVSTSDNITNVAQPFFFGTCASGDTIEILIDGTPVTPSMSCTLGQYAIQPDTAMSDGDHLIRARSTLGASSSLSGILPITVDTVPPVATIDTTPPATTSATDATFTFSANEPTGFECRLDSGTFQPCTSPRNYSGLQLGGHTFTLRPTDLAGNVQAPSLTYTWTIKLAQTITFPAINDRVIGAAPFTVSPTSSAGLPVDLLSLTPAVCEVTTPAPGTVTLLDVGTCTLRAENAGNATFAPAATTRNFVVRPPAPGTPDLSALTDTGASPTDDVTRAATLEFSGSCVDGDTVELIVDTSAVGTPVICASSAWTVSFAVADGAHAIAARSTRAGTASANSASLPVTVDRTAPVAPVITGPSASNQLDVTVVGTGENGATVVVSEGSPLCTSAPVAGGTWSCDVAFATNGTHTVNAVQTDLAGNSSPVSANLVIDVGAQIFANGFE